MVGNCGVQLYRMVWWEGGNWSVRAKESSYEKLYQDISGGLQAYQMWMMFCKPWTAPIGYYTTEVVLENGKVLTDSDWGGIMTGLVPPSPRLLSTSDSLCSSEVYYSFRWRIALDTVFYEKALLDSYLKYLARSWNKKYPKMKVKQIAIYRNVVATDVVGYKALFNQTSAVVPGTDLIPTSKKLLHKLENAQKF
jgi:hypothetical protein